LCYLIFRGESLKSEHFSFFFIPHTEEEEIEEDEGDANQDEFMKAQQAQLAEEKQKLLQNHDMVESVRIISLFHKFWQEKKIGGLGNPRGYFTDTLRIFYVRF